MPSESGCPQTPLLEELAQGRLPAEEAARLAAHAVACARCGETLAALRNEATGQTTAGTQASRSPAGPVSVTTSRTAAASSIDGGTAQLPQASGEFAERSYTAESLEIGPPSTVTSPLPEFPGRKTGEEVYD